MLRLSGTGGLIVRPFRVDGPSPYSVVWVPDALPAALLAAASLPNGCGLVANGRGLGIRVPAEDYATAYAVLRKAQPPAPLVNFELAGAPLGLTSEPLAAALRAEGWPATPLRTFVRNGRRSWILSAEGPPTFSLLRTDEGLATLQPARDRPPRPQQPWTQIPSSRPVAPSAPPVAPPPLAPAAHHMDVDAPNPILPPTSAWANGPPGTRRPRRARPPPETTPSGPLPAASLAPLQTPTPTTPAPSTASVAAISGALENILARLTAMEERLVRVEQAQVRPPAPETDLTAVLKAIEAISLRLDAMERRPPSAHAASAAPATPPRSSAAATADDDHDESMDPDDAASRKREHPTGSPPGAGKKPGRRAK